MNLIEIDPQESSKLHVKHTSGKIKIIGDSKRTHLLLGVSNSNDEFDEGCGYEFVFGVNGEVAELFVIPTEISNPCSIKADFAIYVPASFDVSVELLEGNVDVTGVTCKVEIKENSNPR